MWSTPSEPDPGALWLTLSLWLCYPITFRARSKLALAQMQAPDGYADLVAHLTFDCPGIAADVASRLNVSVRVLHRQLEPLGTTFHRFGEQLLDEVVHDPEFHRYKPAVVAAELGIDGRELLRRRPHLDRS